MPTQIQVRRGTAAQWTAANPTLASGEIGVETDTGKMKFGRLTPTAWNSLIYVTDASFFGGIVTGANGGTGVANTSKTITLGGNLTTSGAHTTTLTTTGPTSVTLPTTGTLATLTGTEVLTAKTLTSPVINGTVTGTAGFGAWQSYVPTFTGSSTNPTFGSSIFDAAWTQFGKTVHVRIKLTLGAGFAAGSGAYSFSLPVTSKSGTDGAISALYVDTSANAVYRIIARLSSNLVNRSYVTDGGAGFLSSSNPVVPASGDIYIYSFTYEAA